MGSLRLLLVILSFSASILAADSPFSGTWKFNPSKGHPTPPIPKSIVAHVEADAENFKFSQEGVDDKDQSFKSSYEAKFDGKEYPITGDPDSHGYAQAANFPHISALPTASRLRWMERLLLLRATPPAMFSRSIQGRSPYLRLPALRRASKCHTALGLQVARTRS